MRVPQQDASHLYPYHLTRTVEAYHAAGAGDHCLMMWHYHASKQGIYVYCYRRYGEEN